jgi:hypothetical protein
MSTSEKFRKLNQQLYPTGGAFGVKEGGVRDNHDTALMISEVEMYEYQLEILDELLPDNPNFNDQYAANWELRLGMITNPPVSLADRMAAIIRKMNHPGDISARQSWDFLQDQLQLAGFDVYVHDNTTALSINQVLAQNLVNVGNFGNNNFGTFNWGSVYTTYSQYFSIENWGQHNFGTFNFGQQINYLQKVVNKIDWQKDSMVQITDWYKVFYIGGPNLGDFATVDVNRREEFRQLILKLKRATNAGFLLINYI